MYTCIHVYMSVCNSMHACVCVCMCVCDCMWLYVIVCGCMWMYVDVCGCMWMYVCVCLCVCMWYDAYVMWCDAMRCDVWKYMDIHGNNEQNIRHSCWSSHNVPPPIREAPHLEKAKTQDKPARRKGYRLLSRPCDWRQFTLSTMIFSWLKTDIASKSQTWAATSTDYHDYVTVLPQGPLKQWGTATIRPPTVVN